MDVWRIEYNMARPPEVLGGEDRQVTFLSYYRVDAHASQLWRSKSERGLDHYARVLNQPKLLVVG